MGGQYMHYTLWYHLYILHVSVVDQSREGVGGWDPRSLAQCCPLCPPEAGRGTTAHQKLEVLSCLSGTELI